MLSDFLDGSDDPLRTPIRKRKYIYDIQSIIAYYLLFCEIWYVVNLKWLIAKGLRLCWICH